MTASVFIFIPEIANSENNIIMVNVKLCLLVIALSGYSIASTDGAIALCTSADTPGTCLFKGMLKIALGYAVRRNGDSGTEKITGSHQLQQQQSKRIEAYLFEQIQNIINMFSFEFDLPTDVTSPWSLLKSSFINGRGKKNKNLGPMLAAGVAVMAGTLMPIAFGALFMLAGKAIMTSLMAITISGLLGLKSLFGKHEIGASHIKTYAAPSPHYTEAQFDQELGIYKGHVEGKMQSSATNFYAGEPNLSRYYDNNYKGEHLSNGSNHPEYYKAGATGIANTSKFHNGNEKE